MLIYLSAPYSRVEDKEKLMERIMRFSGQYMLEHPGEHIVSPLFNHPSIALVPGLAGDYAFWGNYSRELLEKCDGVFVLTFDGWESSTGVKDEIDVAVKLNKFVRFFDEDFFED